MVDISEIKPAFLPVFNTLREYLTSVSDRCVIKGDTETLYSLYTPPVLLPQKKSAEEQFFCAVEIKKNYVSVYVMPVYVNPDLLNGISEKLRKQMQGKSCFNFKKVDEELFAEFMELVQNSRKHYEAIGWL